MHTLTSAVTAVSAALVLALASAASTHAADDELNEETVKALEAKCEEAREAKIKPLRDAEIQKCIVEQRKDPDYCRRYWRDYGAAVRLPDGKIRPRLFDDLPECVAAFEARRKLNLQGK
ncbi:MAG TPA: hypothetical protein VF193_14870 [Steroidobacter sp.]